MTRLAALDCGGDHIEALRFDDGTVELTRTYRSGRIERIAIEATDTLRISTGSLTVVSRCGASTPAVTAANADELERFASALAAAVGCSVSRR